ncbi:MAG: hypothetical protein LBS10_01445 [Gracilibacteraceae bacterium]|jgi:hypothetical protein|nr:hypothetical protein [Gracilibacteraceae bacterium]
MANLEELEIQDWQREPGLKNPLTPEQVEWLETQASEEIWPFYLEHPQTAAKLVLSQGATLREVLDEMFNYE